MTTGAEILHEIIAGNMLSDGTNPNFWILMILRQSFALLQLLLVAVASEDRLYNDRIIGGVLRLILKSDLEVTGRIKQQN